jgi:hypothetical protein
MLQTPIRHVDFGSNTGEVPPQENVIGCEASAELRDASRLWVLQSKSRWIASRWFCALGFSTFALNCLTAPDVKPARQPRPYFVARVIKQRCTPPMICFLKAVIAVMLASPKRPLACRNKWV